MCHLCYLAAAETFGAVRGPKMAAAGCYRAAKKGRATEPRRIVLVVHIADVSAGLGPFGLRPLRQDNDNDIGKSTSMATMRKTGLTTGRTRICLLEPPLWGKGGSIRQILHLVSDRPQKLRSHLNRYYAVQKCRCIDSFSRIIYITRPIYKNWFNYISWTRPFSPLVQVIKPCRAYTLHFSLPPSCAACV